MAAETSPTTVVTRCPRQSRGAAKLTGDWSGCLSRPLHRHKGGSVVACFGTFETTHGPEPAFDAAVILFKPVVQVAAGAVPHLLAQLGPDRARIAVVAIRRDPVWRVARDRLGRAEE